MSLLDIRNLGVRYGTLTAVRDVSLTLAPGEALGLVGESGSGKSSIIGAILGLGDVGQLDGSVAFEGTDLLRRTPRERRALLGRRIGSVFQDPFTALNPSLRIGRQIAEPMMRHLGLTARQAQVRTLDLLRETGIDDPARVAGAYPHQLSGGMKQRTLIAAAIACEPPLLLLDEPTTALDVSVEAQILDLLADLRQRHGIGMLFVSHNLRTVRRICDRVAVLYAGQIVETGSAVDVLACPAHPYAKGLIASLPALQAGPHGSRLPSIAGLMSEAPAPEAGCAFAPRCPFSETRCSEDSQALLSTADGRAARCWKSDRIGAWPPIVGADLGDPAPQPKPVLIAAAGLRKTYGGRRGFALSAEPAPAVDGASLSIAAGEVLGLVGESGCGKSTLGRLLLRLVEPDTGSVLFDGDDIVRRSEVALRPFRQQAQLVFQNVGSSLNPRMTVGEALERPLVLFERLSVRDRQRRVRALLDLVRLSATYETRYPHQLSGGERQRVAIARSLATRPRFLVCDEPVSALDVSVQAAIVNLFADLRDELQLSYLFISHDLAVVAQLSDRIAVMFRGTICEIGPAADVIASPRHPYTIMLLAATRGERAAKVQEIAIATGGCSFYSRCSHRLTLCASQAPSMHRASDDHTVACHLSLPH